MRAAVALVMVGLWPFGSASGEARSSSKQSETIYCGGETDVATVERYFSDLQHALAKNAPKARFNKFVAQEFGVRSKRGHTLYFKVRDIGSVTPSRITIREWQEISRRGARSLNDAGWRGCFMDNGKIWFEGSKEIGFGLTLLSKDMPWVTPENGTTLKLVHPAN